MSKLFAVALTLACLSHQSLAQEVYKCKVDGATVYSQTPCSASAEKIVVKAQAPMGSASDAERAQMEQGYRERVAGTKAAYSEGACLSEAQRRVYRPVEEREAAIRVRIAELELEMTRSNNNLAGAQRDTGFQTEIAELQTGINTSRASADSTMASERQRCAEERQRAEDAAKPKPKPKPD